MKTRNPWHGLIGLAAAAGCLLLLPQTIASLSALHNTVAVARTLGLDWSNTVWQRANQPLPAAYQQVDLDDLAAAEPLIVTASQFRQNGERVATTRCDALCGVFDTCATLWTSGTFEVEIPSDPGVYLVEVCAQHDTPGPVELHLSTGQRDIPLLYAANDGSWGTQAALLFPSDWAPRPGAPRLTLELTYTNDYQGPDGDRDAPIAGLRLTRLLADGTAGSTASSDALATLAADPDRLLRDAEPMPCICPEPIDPAMWMPGEPIVITASQLLRNGESLELYSGQTLPLGLGDYVILWSRATVEARVNTPPGVYLLELVARHDRPGPVNLQLKTADRELLLVFDADDDSWGTQSVVLTPDDWRRNGEERYLELELTFLNDYLGDKGDRNADLAGVRLVPLTLDRN